MNSLFLSKELYNREIIDFAVEAYHDICNVEVCDSEEYFVCKFEDCIYSESITMKEFENYIIDSIVSGSINV